MLPESPVRLYWSIRGEVACINHVPQGERWKSERWEPLPATYRGSFQCRHCSPDQIAFIRETMRKEASPRD
jgi:hypothetical protein